MTGAIPVGRMCEPDGVSHTVRFALENDYMNGRVIDIDSGFRI